MRAVEVARVAIFHGWKNVKLVGLFADFTDGKDGSTHISMEDVGIMRSIPMSKVFSPSGPIILGKMLKAIIEYEGPVYLRIENEAYPDFYDEDFIFEIGKSYVLRDGSDVSILAYGSATSRAMEAAEKLEKKGISAEIIDVPTIKPFDSETLIKSVLKTGKLITVEDHNIYGGLASAASETISQNSISVKFKVLGIKDVFNESGEPKRLREKYGVSTDHIYCAAMEICGR